jgi:hypothetical protein
LLARSRIARSLLVALALALIGAPALSSPAGKMTASADFPNPVPCSDPRGCPDLIVQPVKLMQNEITSATFGSNSCDVVEGMITAGNHRILRFDFTTPNLGPGDLIVGSPSAHPEWFVYSSCHNHYHFREYADYRLWTVDGYVTWLQLRKTNPDLTAEQVLAQHPELLGEFVEGEKRGFCVIDLEYLGLFPGGVEPRHFGSCGYQGITVRWADEYVPGLAGQYITIDGVASGVYMLEAEVNAERLYREADYTNNYEAVPVFVP